MDPERAILCAYRMRLRARAVCIDMSRYLAQGLRVESLGCMVDDVACLLNEADAFEHHAHVVTVRELMSMARGER